MTSEKGKTYNPYRLVLRNYYARRNIKQLLKHEMKI